MTGALARIVVADAIGIEEASQLLKAGQVVGMPTETVYGLAGNAWDESALARIFSTKERPVFDPLIVHVARELCPLDHPLEALAEAGLLELSALTSLGRIRAAQLIAAFWPGPLTLVLPKGSRVPDLATSGLDTVAIRMPRHPIAQALLKSCGLPLAAPSANRFGRISPTSAQDVLAELGDRIPLILDGGRCTVGVESTVVYLDSDGSATLLRPGGTPKDEIEAVLGFPLRLSSGTGALASPGMLASHYAPRKALYLLPQPILALSLAQQNSIQNLIQGFAHIGLLLQSGPQANRALPTWIHQNVTIQVLSESGDLNESARRLFSHLRALDDSDAQVILSEPCLTRKGLGHAISDRLSRAAHP